VRLELEVSDLVADTALLSVTLEVEVCDTLPVRVVLELKDDIDVPLAVELRDKVSVTLELEVGDVVPDTVILFETLGPELCDVL
jgi:hypothetical protein